MNAQQTDCSSPAFGPQIAHEVQVNKIKTSEAFRVTVLWVVCIFIFFFTFIVSEYVYQLQMQKQYRKPHQPSLPQYQEDAYPSAT